MYRYLSVLLSKLKTVSLSNFTLPAQDSAYLVPLHRKRPPFCSAPFPQRTTLHNPHTIRSTHELCPFLPSPTHLQPSSSHLTSHIISPSCPKTKHFPEGPDRGTPNAFLGHTCKLSPITQLPHPLITGASPPCLSSNSNQRREHEPTSPGAPFIPALTKPEN